MRFLHEDIHAMPVRRMTDDEDQTRGATSDAGRLTEILKRPTGRTGRLTVRPVGLTVWTAALNVSSFCYYKHRAAHCPRFYTAFRDFFKFSYIFICPSRFFLLHCLRNQACTRNEKRRLRLPPPRGAHLPLGIVRPNATGASPRGGTSDMARGRCGVPPRHWRRRTGCRSARRGRPILARWHRYFP